MKSILSIQNLKKQFGGLTAVNNLNFEVYLNQINTLIGPNGSGKTTTLNMVAGTLPSTSGKIIFQDEDITRLEEYQIVRRGIRRTFQNLSLFSSMSVLENVMVGGQTDNESILKYLLDIPHARTQEKALLERALSVMEEMGIVDLRDKIMKDVPYGQQKMVEISRSMMTSPKLLLLDEPATGLNPTERAALNAMLQEIKSKGITILLIEHNMDIVMKVSDWITVINFGTKIAEGPPKEIQNNDQVIEAYLGARFKKGTV